MSEHAFRELNRQIVCSIFYLFIDALELDVFLESVTRICYALFYSLKLSIFPVLSTECLYSSMRAYVLAL